MTIQQALIAVTLDSAAVDLSGNQFRFVDMLATGVGVPTGAGAKAIGVLQNKPGQESATPAAGGFPCEVAVSGVVKVATGAVAVAVGAKVQSDAAGKALLAASGDHVLGTCTKAGVAEDDLMEVLLQSHHLLV